jgi:RecA/RadA recombinase
MKAATSAPALQWANPTVSWQERAKVLLTDEVRAMIPAAETDTRMGDHHPPAPKRQ